MRIAVTSMEKNLDSQVSERFGRSLYVFVADTETRVVRIVDNHAFVELGLGSGTKIAEMLASMGVEWVATGKIGGYSFQTLNNSGISVVSPATGSCREILDRLAAGGVKAATGPTGEVEEGNKRRD